jgi:predicted cobalt transporter CbtA
VFQRIFLTALIAGVVAGLFAAGVQRIKIIPLIERAEVYRRAKRMAEMPGQARRKHGSPKPASNEPRIRHWPMSWPASALRFF